MAPRILDCAVMHILDLTHPPVKRLRGHHPPKIQQRARDLTAEQLPWLALIRDHIATSLGIEPEDFEYAPFSQRGGLGKVRQLFGEHWRRCLTN